MCLTLATYLPYLVLPTETKAMFCVEYAWREFETQPPWPKLGTNGPDLGHPAISVTNNPILTFDGSNESQ